MLRIDRDSNGGILFTLVGVLDAEHVAELERLLGLEENGRRLVLNLRDVTLADNSGLRFLARCESNGVRLDGCPAYMRASIDREKHRK
jgi:anti-anti-sigma regulatory factor